MMKFRTVLMVSVVGVAAAGCVVHKASVCDANLVCTDPSIPFCDLDGAIAGDPQTCIAVNCRPGDFGACRGDSVLACNASGDNYDVNTCPNGCDPVIGCKACVTGAMRCADDGSVLVCGDNGVETVDHSCPNGCTAAVCNACVPGTERCSDDGSVLHCDADGTESIKQTCDNGCFNAACKTCATDAERCSAADGNVLVCDATGVESVKETCSAGCTSTGAAHCSYLQPKYLPDVCDTPATDDFTISTQTTIDLSTACNGGMINQGSDLPICVIHHKSITITSGAVAGFPRITPMVVALVGDDFVDISGAVSVDARGSDDGTGGGNVISGSVVATNVGASGASGGTKGGDGCAGTTVQAGPQAQTSPIQLDVLRGGARANGTGGGGAGGGITVIACRGPVRVSGLIDAVGGGGIGGGNSNSPGGGRGGGAGGTIVLQGLSLDVTGMLFANGGGGGSGDGDGFGSGKDGNGSVTPAAGGMFTSTGGGAGGAGGALGAPPVGGSCVSGKPGGGGGSVGFLIGYTPVGASNTLTATASPAISPIQPATLR